MNSFSPLSNSLNFLPSGPFPTVAALPDLRHVRLLVVSDAAPARNGAGSYYQDLLPLLRPSLATAELFSPTIDAHGSWKAGLSLPLPGDATQRLCIPDFGELHRLFRSLRPHIIIIATPGVYGLSAALLARWRGVPFLAGFHTCFERIAELYWPDSWRGKVVERYLQLSNGFLLRHGASVIGNSATVLEQAQSLGARSLDLLGTPLSGDFLSEPLHAHSGRIDRCLFAGRLAPEKNVDALLHLARTIPDLEISIAGDGPLRALVEQSARELPNLKYLGWLTRGALRQAIDGHDMLLLPSHFETFGTIALEAMARGRPAMVSRASGISDWSRLTDGLLICRQGHDFVAALTELRQQQPDAIKQWAEAALNCSRHFNAAVAGDWLSVLSRLLAGTAAL